MKRTRGLLVSLVFLSLLAAFGASAHPEALAQSDTNESDSMERILLPVIIDGEVNGAYGSRWASVFAVTNTGSTPVTLDGILTSCVFPICELPTLAPGATAFPTSSGIYPPFPGAFLEVEAGRADDLHVQLRVQDLSRQSLTWGTEIPVIHEDDAFDSTVSLTDIPVEPRFRHLLRIYGFQPHAAGEVRIRVFRVNPAVQYAESATSDALLADSSVRLAPHPESDVPPSYAQLELGLLSGVQVGDRLRVEITPSAGLRIWAFVSVTNNETQHVTVITPQQVPSRVAPEETSGATHPTPALYR